MEAWLSPCQARTLKLMDPLLNFSTWSTGTSEWGQLRNTAYNLQFLHGQPRFRCLNQDSPTGVRRLTWHSIYLELAPNTYFQLQTILNGTQDWKFLPRNREQEAFRQMQVSQTKPRKTLSTQVKITVTRKLSALEHLVLMPFSNNMLWLNHVSVCGTKLNSI